MRIGRKGSGECEVLGGEKGRLWGGLMGVWWRKIWSFCILGGRSLYWRVGGL